MIIDSHRRLKTLGIASQHAPEQPPDGGICRCASGRTLQALVRRPQASEERSPFHVPVGRSGVALTGVRSTVGRQHNQDNRALALGRSWISVVVLLGVLAGGTGLDRALGQPTAELDQLIAALSSGPQDERIRAAVSIRRLGKAASRAVPALVAALADEAEPVRLRVCFALCGMGDAAAPAVPALVAMVDKFPPKSCGPFILALGELSASIPDAGRSFRQLLAHPHAKVRLKAIMWLSGCALGTTDVVSDLVRLLAAEKDPVFKEPVVRALRFYGAASAPAVGLLIESLRVPDYSPLQYSAAMTLASIGPTASEALSSLESLERSTDAALRAAAKYAAWQIARRGDDVVAAIADCLRTTEYDTIDMIEALQEMGPIASSATDVLLLRLHDQRPAIRLLVVRCLGTIHSSGDPVVKALGELLPSADPRMAVELVTTLASIGDTNKKALDLIQLAAQDSRIVVREAVCRAASSLGGRAACLARDIVPYLGDDHLLDLALLALGSICTDEAISGLVEGCELFAFARPKIVAALGEIGPAAGIALPYLRELAGTPAVPRAEREAAVNAIYRISQVK